MPLTNRIDAKAKPSRRTVEEFTEAGETLLYHPDRDEATVLNRSASEVWRLCDGSANPDEIAAALGKRYGVDSALLQKDVTATLIELSSRDLIELL